MEKIEETEEELQFRIAFANQIMNDAENQETNPIKVKIEEIEKEKPKLKRRNLDEYKELSLEEKIEGFVKGF